MVRRLVKHEDGYAVVLDQSVLDALKLGPDTRFEVLSDGSSIVLMPVAGDEEFDAATERLHARFGDALKRLAE